MNKELEEAIKRCNQLIKVEHANWIGISNQSAIETALKELERLQEENAELKLKERNRRLGKYGEIEIHDLINKTLQEDYIPKDKTREKIKEIQKYEEAAREQIEESIVIVDGDSLNFGRKQAHGKDIEVLKDLLEGK